MAHTSTAGKIFWFSLLGVGILLALLIGIKVFRIMWGFGIESYTYDPDDDSGLPISFTKHKQKPAASKEKYKYWERDEF
jgi:hypothetical protein